MIHLNWKDRPVLKQVKCIHTDAKKYIVHNVLTKGKTYNVVNETSEFYFIVDNTNQIGGYYKEYFKEK